MNNSIANIILDKKVQIHNLRRKIHLKTDRSELGSLPVDSFNEIVDTYNQIENGRNLFADIAIRNGAYIKISDPAKAYKETAASNGDMKSPKQICITINKRGKKKQLMIPYETEESTGKALISKIFNTLQETLEPNRIEQTVEKDIEKTKERLNTYTTLKASKKSRKVAYDAVRHIYHMPMI